LYLLFIVNYFYNLLLRKSSKDADVVLERNERDDDESEEEIPISDEESGNDSNAEAVEATSNAPRKESQSKHEVISINGLYLKFLHVRSLFLGGDGRFAITNEEYKGLPYPPTYLTYAGKGSGKESFLFTCHLDHCQTKNKTISVTKDSRGNIRKDLKVRFFFFSHYNL